MKNPHGCENAKFAADLTIVASQPLPVLVERREVVIGQRYVLGICPTCLDAHDALVRIAHYCWQYRTLVVIKFATTPCGTLPAIPNILWEKVEVGNGDA